MTFDELLQELFDRGASYLDEDAQSQARASRWLNAAYREIAGLYAWPFLEAETTGTAGAGFVTIPDLRKLLLVKDTMTGQPLDRTTRQELVRERWVTDLTQTGTPDSYYVQGSDVKTWPVGGTVYALYIKRLAPMTGTDTPAFDEEYHDLIVDRAFIKVYKDSDNFEAAAALRQEYEEGVRAMAEDYHLDSREVLYLEPTGDDL